MIPHILTAVVLAALPTGPDRGRPEVRLLVRPMAAPEPALKYQLLPALEELSTGNAAPAYLKCFAEQRPFFYGKPSVTDRARYRTMPLLELRLERLGQYGSSVMRHANRAARLQTIDWQMLPRASEGGLEGPPPELGPLQLLAEVLQVRFRSEVAANRFDDAIVTAKTMLALGRHLGEYPAEVGGMLGLWVAHLGLDTLEEMVQQPQCPNLYWALTDLPCPLVDLRRAVHGERIRVASEWKTLRDDAPMVDSELESLVGRLSGVTNYAREQAGLAPGSLRQRLRLRVEDASAVAAARRRLVGAGCDRELADRFPPTQVILLDSRRDHEIRRDERLKLLGLPLWQIVDAEGKGSDRGGLLDDLLPRVVKIRRTQAALEQQIALLRHVEALRLYAAGHDGKLPSRLADIPVPLPADPVTDRPIGYVVEGKTAHLRGASPRGDRTDVHYVVTLL